MNTHAAVARTAEWPSQHAAGPARTALCHTWGGKASRPSAHHPTRPPTAPARPPTAPARPPTVQPLACLQDAVSPMDSIALHTVLLSNGRISEPPRNELIGTYPLCTNKAHAANSTPHACLISLDP